MTRFALTAALLAFATGAFAQSHQPYAGHQSRSVKALSEEQIADLRAGRGMGLALPAELNGYPGPLHVIEHADALALNADQRARMRQLFESMKTEAVAVGERLISQETELDRQFVSRSITEASLAAKTAEIGQTQAALRATHLRYHLLTVEVLTPEQTKRYAELRGYAGSEQPTHQPGRHHR
jgi:Spy/CpxP family protein refolding chaperone